jgi:hypothetical protein
MANSLGGLENTFNEWFVKKAPFQLPKGLKDVVVAFVPWIALIGGVMAVLAALAIFGLGGLVAPLTMYGGAGVASTYVFSLAVLGVAGVLELMAFPGLRKRSIQGWRLLFYAELVWAVSELINFNLVSFVLGTVIGLYFLFQIKEYYK